VTTAYERSHAAGYADALAREADGVGFADASTWFVYPLDEHDASSYERGGDDGWAEYLTAREPRDRP